MTEQLPGVVRMGMIRRIPSLTPTEFSDHWKGPHGTIASHIPNLKRYHQNHAFARLAVRDLLDHWSLDGLSELWFADIDTMLRSIGSPQYAPLAKDTPTVMTMPGLIAGVQEVVVAGPADKSAFVKAMVVVGRDPALSASTFATRWREQCAHLERLLDLRAAVNTFVRHWEVRPGELIPYEHLPVDAVTELWFSSEDAMRKAFVADLPDLLAPKHGSVIANASGYAMKTYVIVA
jgi:hypothetical protein